MNIAITGEPMLWTDERVETLMAMRAKRISSGKIALELGVTRSAVMGKLNRIRAAEKAALEPQKMLVKPLPTPVKMGPSAPRSFGAVEPRGAATVMTLNHTTCKWPIGDPQSDDFTFCGKRPDKGVYCPAHAKIAYNPPPRRTSRATVNA